MKAQGPGQRAAGGGKKRPVPRLSHIPMEWMDPMSWRLPSGKALAEFALQAGFLAPLMLSGPQWKRKAKRNDAAFAPVAVDKEAVAPAEEGRDAVRTFRETR